MAISNKPRGHAEAGRGIMNADGGDGMGMLGGYPPNPNRAAHGVKGCRGWSGFRYPQRVVCVAHGAMSKGKGTSGRCQLRKRATPAGFRLCGHQCDSILTPAPPGAEGGKEGGQQEVVSPLPRSSSFEARPPAAKKYKIRIFSPASPAREDVEFDKSR